ncbi:MAG: hypothetical protein WCG42_04205 [Parachlamydiaceae bacterium]
MHIQPLLDKAADISKNVLAEGKTTTFWLGHQIQVFWTTAAIPSIKKLCEVAMVNFRFFQQFAKSTPVAGVAICATFFLATRGAFLLAEKAGDNNKSFLKATWNLVGIATLIGGVAVSIATISTGLKY